MAAKHTLGKNKNYLYHNNGTLNLITIPMYGWMNRHRFQVVHLMPTLIVMATWTLRVNNVDDIAFVFKNNTMKMMPHLTI